MPSRHYKWSQPRFAKGCGDTSNNTLPGKHAARMALQKRFSKVRKQFVDC
jgi:hypothetical protein